MKKESKEKLIPPPSIRDESPLKGFLQKRYTNKIGLASWKRIYIKLVDGHALWYAESPQALITAPQGWIGKSSVLFSFSRACWCPGVE